MSLFDEVHARSLRDPEGFWGEAAEAIEENGPRLRSEADLRGSLSNDSLTEDEQKQFLADGWTLQVATNVKIGSKTWVGKGIADTTFNPVFRGSERIEIIHGFAGADPLIEGAQIVVRSLTQAVTHKCGGALRNARVKPAVDVAVDKGGIYL